MKINVQRFGAEALEVPLDRVILPEEFEIEMRADTQLGQHDGAADAIHDLLLNMAEGKLNEKELALIQDLREQEATEQSNDHMIRSEIIDGVSLSMFNRIIETRTNASQRVFTLGKMDMRNLGGDRAIIDQQMIDEHEMSILQEAFNGALMYLIKTPVKVVFKAKKLIEPIQIHPNMTKDEKRRLERQSSILRCMEDVKKWIIRKKNIDASDDMR